MTVRLLKKQSLRLIILEEFLKNSKPSIGFYLTLSVLLFSNLALAQLTHSGNFIHLGAVEDNAELQFVKEKIEVEEEPWITEFNQLLSWAVTGNTNNVGSGEDGPRDLCKNAYANALAWHYTGNTIYADRAVNILNAWANNFTGYPSATGQNLLVGGWIGTLLGPSAELMRNYPGWTTEEQAALKAMFENHFYPVINTMSTWNGNVDLTQIQAMLAIAVFNEDVDEFNAGLARLALRNPAYYYLSTDAPELRNYGGSTEASWGSGSAVTDWVDGLTQETCRDNGHHAQFAMAATLAAAEIAWHQGIDVYAQEEKRYVATLELMALQLSSGNMQGTCADNLTSSSRFNTFEIGYNHYHNRMGLDLPETEKILPVSASSQDSWNIFFETLTHRGTGQPSRACQRPDLGDTKSLCNDNIQLNTGLSAAGRTFTWYKDNIKLTNEVSPTLNVTDSGTYRVEVDSAGCMTSDETVIIGAFPIDLGDDQTLCNSSTITLDAGNINGPSASYLWNTGEETQSISISTAGTFSVSVDVPNCGTVSDAVTITSDLLRVTSEVLCAEGEVTMAVEDSGDFEWFLSESDEQAIGSGSTVTTSITTNQTFYVEDVGAVSATIGKIEAGSGESWAVSGDDLGAPDKVLNVTVSETITLNSLDVYVRTSGSVTINFKQGINAVHSKTFTGLNAGKQTLALNFIIEPGSYVLDALGSSSELTFEASGASFPYSHPNYLSFTFSSSWQSDWYGLYYNWDITIGNTCARTPVHALIDDSNPDCVLSSTSEESTSTIELYPNPARGQLYIKTPLTKDEIVLRNSIGEIKVPQNIDVNDTETMLDISNVEPGIYFIEIAGSVSKILIQ